MYQSKYYTCEEIDERLLQGYYNDVVANGYPGTFSQFKTWLSKLDDSAEKLINYILTLNQKYPIFGSFGFFTKTGYISNRTDKNWRTTDFIRVSVGTTFDLALYGVSDNVFCLISCFDSNKTFLSEESHVISSYIGTYTVPTGVTYIRFSGSPSSTITCTSGTTILTVFDVASINAAQLEGKFDKDSVVQTTGTATDKVMSQAAATEALDVLDVYTKLGSDMTPGLDILRVVKKTNGYLASASGKYSNVYDTNWFSTDFIKVNPGISFKLYITGASSAIAIIACYDADRNYLKDKSIIQDKYEGVYSVPQGVSYIRFSGSSKSLKTGILTAKLLGLNGMDSVAYEYATIDPDTGELVADETQTWKTTPMLHWQSCIGSNNVYVKLTGQTESSVLVALYDSNFSLKSIKQGSSLSASFTGNTYVRFSSCGDSGFNGVSNIFVRLGTEELQALNDKFTSIEEAAEVAVATATEAAEAAKAATEALEAAVAYKDTIFCDGDSLTWGDLGSGAGNALAEHNYPTVLQSLLGEGYLVKNCGIPGAPSATIVANATGYRTREAFTIPAEAGGTVIFKCSMLRSIEGVSSWTFAPMHSHHSSYGMENPCWINGVKGFIDGTKESGDTEYSAIFKRTEAGDEVKVEIGDLVLTNEVVFKDKGTHIIYMGANGGYGKGSTTESINELVGQTDNIIAVSSDLYIVMSHCNWGTGSNPWEGESVFEEKYGDHYLNLRKYYSESGINDALERGYLVNEDPDNPTYPTADDTTRMANGQPAGSLLATDGVHYNDVGYHLLGDLVFKKYKELYKAKVLGTLK